jgi:hypothetical protein
MSTQSGLTRRRGAGGATAGNGSGSGDAETSNGAGNKSNAAKDSAPETSYESNENGHKIAFDPRDISESAERSKQPKLTMMEEVLLLGLKDKQVRRLRDELSSPLARTHAYASSRRPELTSHNRATFPFGTTTSPTPSAAASSSSWPSAAASPWKRTPPGGASPSPTAISKL